MNINLFYGFSHVLVEVAFALIPLLIFFLCFQFFVLKLPLKKLKDILIGVFLTYWGLAFFLQGVHIGFMPAGEAMGQILGERSTLWVMVPIGFLLGFVATFAEPAVRILNQQVEKVSGGYIPQKVMLYTLSVGVAISVALSILLVRYSSPTFTAVAFDSGGVATGPLTASFLISLFVGLSSVLEGRDPLIDGFGMVALVALTPILSVLLLGLLYTRKEKENERSFQQDNREMGRES
jgi:hypothetical protein